MDVTIFVPMFIAIFAVVDPLGNVPLFVALTQDYSVQEKKKVINKIVIVAAITLILFGLIGQYIFMLFSISIPAFQIAGGILIFKIGFDMIQGGRPSAKRTNDEKDEALERQAVGIVPLGIPIFAGPGSISAVMLYVSHPQTNTMDYIVQLLLVLISILFIMIISYFLLRNASRIFDKFGKLGTLAISRIMGLIITAMAVQFFLNGLQTVLTQWGLL